MKTVMQTASGIMFDLANPSAADVRAEDVAHHLAQINRFTGATSRPYSVAAHCLNACAAAWSHGYGVDVMLQALCHDAEEAYTGDVPPMHKALLGDAWDHFADPIKTAVGEALGVYLHNLHPIVHEIDQMLLYAEARIYMPDPSKFVGIPGLRSHVREYSDPAANWLSSYRFLANR